MWKLFIIVAIMGGPFTTFDRIPLTEPTTLDECYDTKDKMPDIYKQMEDGITVRFVFACFPWDKESTP